MAVVRDGPDVQLFTHPGALTKLALWVGEAIVEQERGRGGRKPTPLVLASLNERRDLYVVVGTGGRGLDFGKSEKEREQRRKAKDEKRKEMRQEKERARELKRAARQAARKAKADAAGKKTEDSEEVEDAEDETEGETEEEDRSDEDSDSDEEEDEDAKQGRNRFGNSFQEVVAETNARVRIESFDHCVVEVKKDDLGVFLEALSSKSVMS